MPRSTYYRLRGKPEHGAAEDPIADAVEEEFRKSGGRYGARRIKRALAKRKITASRRRIGEAMKSRNLASRYAKAKLRPHPGKPNEAELPSVLNRELDGHAPHTHVVSDLTYVRVLGAWCCICLLICSQFPPARWHAKLGEGAIADAVIDRIVHRSDIIHIEGDESMRKRVG